MSRFCLRWRKAYSMLPLCESRTVKMLKKWRVSSPMWKGEICRYISSCSRNWRHRKTSYAHLVPTLCLLHLRLAVERGPSPGVKDA